MISVSRKHCVLMRGLVIDVMTKYVNSSHMSVEVLRYCGGVTEKYCESRSCKVGIVVDSLVVFETPTSVLMTIQKLTQTLCIAVCSR